MSRVKKEAEMAAVSSESTARSGYRTERGSAGSYIHRRFAKEGELITTSRLTPASGATALSSVMTTLSRNVFPQLDVKL